MSVSSTFEVGELFAKRYKLIRPLGKGGMGQVFLATDKMMGNQQLAIKILHPELSQDVKHAQRFTREVQLNRKINHNNVVKSFDVGIFEDVLFITMEYVEGQTLKEKLEVVKRFSSQDAARILKEICTGLAEVHNAEIIHRDLKPGNVLITNAGVVKIGDFGVARPAMSDLTAHDEIIGCAPYIAPEVWLGKPVCIQSDLYALGVLAYEMLAGELPFDGNSPVELMRKHLDSRPFPIDRAVPETPGWLSNLVLKLLEKDPRDRFASAHEVVNYIAKCLANPEAGIVGGTTTSGSVDGSLLEALNRAETKMIEPEPSEPTIIPRRVKQRERGDIQQKQPAPAERPTRSAPQLAQLATKRKKGKDYGESEQTLNLTSTLLRLILRGGLIALLLAVSWSVDRFCSPALKRWWSIEGREFWDVILQIAVGPLSLIAASLTLALPMLCVIIMSPTYRVSLRSLVITVTKVVIGTAAVVLLSCGYLVARSIHAATELSTFSFNSLWRSYEAALQAATPAFFLIPKPVASSFMTEIPAPILIRSQLSFLEAAPFYVLTILVLWQSALCIRNSIFKTESIAWYQTVPRIMLVGVLFVAVESYFYATITKWLSSLVTITVSVPIPPGMQSIMGSDLALGIFNWGAIWMIAAFLPRKRDQ